MSLELTDVTKTILKGLNLHGGTIELCDQNDRFGVSRSNIRRSRPKLYCGIRTQSKSLGFGLLTLPLLLTALSSSTSSSSELELPELVDGGITLSRVLEKVVDLGTE